MRGFGRVLRSGAGVGPDSGSPSGFCRTVLHDVGRISERNRVSVTGSYRCLTAALRRRGLWKTRSCLRQAFVRQRPASALQRSCEARHTARRASRRSDEAIPSVQTKTWAVNQASRPIPRVPAPVQSRPPSCSGRFCDVDRRHAPAASPPSRGGWRLRPKRWG
jgi:hypothetical protein